MSPLTFLADPPLWLLSVSRYRCSATAGPNFSFALSARKWDWNRTKLEKTQGVPFDLSHVNTVLSGAEPVRYDTNKAFLGLFAQSGLQAGAFRGSYGQAESCVFICGASSLRLAPPDIDGKRHVCCGNVDMMRREIDYDIRIANPDTGEIVPDGEVGEICVSSRAVAGGYFGKPELSKEAFQFEIKTLPGKKFLKTGDLGLVTKPDREWCIEHPHSSNRLANEKMNARELDELHLVVTGRVKDLIIINGRNFYPQDIELAFERALDPERLLREGCSVAFSVDTACNDTEELACVGEIRAAEMKAYIKSQAPLTSDQVYHSVCTSILKKIAFDEGVLPSTIVLIEERTLPKTTSGKVQRRKTKQCLKDASLQIVYRFDRASQDKEIEQMHEDEPDIASILESSHFTNVSDEISKEEPAAPLLYEQELLSTELMVEDRILEKEQTGKVWISMGSLGTGDESTDGIRARRKSSMSSMVSIQSAADKSVRARRRKRSSLSLGNAAGQRPAAFRPRRESSLRVEILDLFNQSLPETDMEEFNQHSAFDELGIDSIRAVEFATKLNNQIGVDMSPTALYSYPTVDSLSKHIIELQGQEAKDVVESMQAVERLLSGASQYSNVDVAIVGIGLRLPGSVDNLRKLWACCAQGVDLLKYSQEDKRHPDQSGGFLDRDHIELFDNKFFCKYLNAWISTVGG